MKISNEILHPLDGNELNFHFCTQTLHNMYYYLGKTQITLLGGWGRRWFKLSNLKDNLKNIR